jgi:hypothetical protein
MNYNNLQFIDTLLPLVDSKIDFYRLNDCEVNFKVEIYIPKYKISA